MKRLAFLMIVQAAVAACSVYRTREQTTASQTQYAESRDTIAELSQLSQYRQELMQRWRYDSLGFGMLIHAQGGYRLLPDSGLTGDNALIWLNGQRTQVEAMQHEATVDSAGSQTRSRLSTAMAAQRQQRTESLVRSRQWPSWAGWGMMVVGMLAVGGMWWFWKKIRWK